MMSFNSGSIISSIRTEKSIVKTNVSFIRSRAIVIKVLYELSSLFGVCLLMFMSPYPMMPALSDLCHFHFVIFLLYRRRQNNNFSVKKKRNDHRATKQNTKKNTRRQTQPSNFRMSYRSSFRAAISFNPLSSLIALSNFHHY